MFEVTNSSSQHQDEHKPVNSADAPSIFHTSDVDETFYLRGAGKVDPNNPKYVLLIMDNTRRHNVLLIIVATRERADAKDVSGTLQFSTVKDLPTSCEYRVMQNREEVGTVRNRRRESIMIITNNDPQELLNGKSAFHDGIFTEEVFDGTGQKLGGFSNSLLAVMKITCRRLLTVSQKKMLLAQAIKVAVTLKRICDYNIFVRFSCLPLNYDEHASRAIQAAQQLQHIRFSTQRLILRLAGHNSSKNIVYFDLYDKTPILTLECTPLENFHGFVKLTAKTDTGEIMFHAVNFSQNDTLAIYSASGALIMYNSGNVIYDSADITQLHLEEKHGQSVEFGFYLNLHHRLLAKIGPHMCAVDLFLPQPSYRFNSFAMIVSVALKAYCETYGFDKHPQPEISYCYRSAEQSTKFIVGE